MIALLREHRIIPRMSWADAHDIAASSGSKLEFAKKMYVEAVRLAENNSQAVHSMSGLAAVEVLRSKNLKWAEQALRERVAYEPFDAGAYLNLSACFLKQGNLTEAENYLGVAFTLSWELDGKAGYPGELTAHAWNNLAQIHAIKGDYDNELFAAEKSAFISPANSPYLAMTIAKRNPVDWSRFFDLYSKRKSNSLDRSIVRIPDDWTGKTVFVAHEQGLGDFFMCAQAFRWLKKKGAAKIVFFTDNKALLALDPSLVDGLDEIVSSRINVNFETDVVMSLMDLIRFRDEWASGDPYVGCGLSCEDLVGKHSGAVGVNFTGNPDFAYEFCRGIYDEDSRQVILGAVGEYCDLSDNGGSLVDLIVKLKSLSLVITTDTLVSHVAGSVGTPCLTMLAVNRDWRWYHHWYNGHRLLVQEEFMDWGDVAKRVAEFVKWGESA